MMFEEASPADVDMDEGLVNHARKLLYDLHQTGKYPALQVCIRRHGKVVLHEAIGRYRPIGGTDQWQPVDYDTRFALFSVSKCVAATCMHILFDRNVLRVDDLVSWYIPEYAQKGKEYTTIRHLLSHQAGIPMILWHVTDELLLDWDQVIQRICEQTAWHPPGRRTGYHMISGGFVLAEIIRRVDGRDIRTFLKDEILDPLGFETFNFGVDEAWYSKTACSERVDRLPPGGLVPFLSRLLDVDLVQALAVMNRPAILESVIPSGNIVGTANETSRFFQMLLNGGELDGQRILSPEQIRRATIEQVMATTDWTLFFTPQRYSLGFMLGRKSTDINVFGKDTAATFGHLGFMRNLGWADPDSDIAGAILTSGKPVKPTREILIFREFQNTLRMACNPK